MFQFFWFAKAFHLSQLRCKKCGENLEGAFVQCTEATVMSDVVKESCVFLSGLTVISRTFSVGRKELRIANVKVEECFGVES